jgi:acyl carrier protein
VFTIEDLMDLLVAKAGLPGADRSDDPGHTFADVGLDSLAFLQLQSELKDRYGFELPDDRAQTYTFGEIVADVNARIEERVA